MKRISQIPKNIRVLCLTSFIDGLVAIGPLWSLYIDELKGSLISVGLLLGIFSLATAFFQLPGGYFTDHFGRRKALIGGGILRIISLIYIGAVSHWHMLIPGFVLMSIAGALGHPAKSALVAESVAEHRRGRTFGLIDTIQAVTMIVGPTLGLFIAGKLNISIVFYFSAVLSVFSLILNIKLLDEMIEIKKPKTISIKEIIKKQFTWTKNKNLNILMISQGMANFAASFAGPFFTLFATKNIGVKKESLAIIFMLNNVLLMLTRIPMGHLVDNPNFKKKYFLVWGCVWGAFAWILISFSQNYLHLFSFILLSLAFVLPARSTLLSEMVTSEQRGRVFGVLAFVDGISGTLGYTLAGYFAEAYGIPLSMKVAGLGLIITAFFIGLVFKEKRKLKVAFK